MKYTERREFLYDPALFTRGDVATALKIHDEFVRRMTPRPCPRFREVDRRPAAVDTLWHQPSTPQTVYLRELEVPCIVRFSKLNWAIAKTTGRTAAQAYTFWTSNLVLKELDYFPLQGDIVYYAGHNLEITDISFDENAYWQQTNVWLGITYTAVMVPHGDHRPELNPAVSTPAALADPSARPVPIRKGELLGSPLPQGG